MSAGKRRRLIFLLLAVTGLAAVLFLPPRPPGPTAARAPVKPARQPTSAVAGVGASNQPPPPVVAAGLVPANGLTALPPKAGVNPYAGALQVPGKSKRAWDADFIKQFQNAVAGTPIQFELTEGRLAQGIVRITQYRKGELSYVSGLLSEPGKGEFFFLTPPVLGVAGKAVGIIQFAGSQTAYRIEPTGPNGDPELWERRLDEVICVSMPKPMAAATNALPAEPVAMTPLRPDEVYSSTPSYNSNLVSLQSLPGATGVLYLDFAGGYTPTWGGVYYSKPAGINEYTIRDVWKRVAEDYLPFNINVTTDFQVYNQAAEISRQRVAFTDTPVTAAGVAFMGSWNWGGDTPCWSVYSTGKNAGEVASHEAGHTVGLSHQGQWDGTNTTNEYYGGQGSGETGWAPIMGVGYYQPVAQWAKGEYNAANQKEDELSIIVNNNNNIDYRVDDTGKTLATSRYLEINPDNSASGEGVIETTGDTDSFQFTTTGGTVSLTARPVADWANDLKFVWGNVAMSVTIANSAGTIIVSNNPQNTLWARANATLAAGTYTFNITGAGRNNPLTDGFSSYGSLGYYSIVGYVNGARQPTRLTLMEKVSNGTVVGTVPPTVAGNLTYTIISGNTGSTFAIATNGTLSVANNTLLDYQKRATNALYFDGFELFVNIVNNDNATLTETNRRVVVTLLNAAANNPLAATGYNARVIVPYNATTAAPQATGFDIPGNWAFYQEGLNANPQIAVSGDGLAGFPADRMLRSQADNTIFQFGPYGGTNALMLGNTYPTSGTLTLTPPQSLKRLSILAASAQGGGVGTFVLNFTNGTKSQVFNFNAQDWYNVTANVAVEGFGRVQLGQSTFNTENPGWDNPNLYNTTIDLAALGINQTIGSITFTNPPVTGSRSTGILAISGQAMADAVAIAVQPVSTTNSAPAATASFSVVAVGAPTLRYQWYFGNPGSGTVLTGQTGSTLTLSSIQTTNAGNYYVVVTNNTSLAASSVATLTVFRAPQIVQQPAPTSATRAVGKSISYSVVANAATPVSYYWRTNGIFRLGATAATLNLTGLNFSNAAAYTVIVSNAFGSVTSSPVTLTMVPTNYPYAQLVQADNPIGYWRLDEASGTTALDCVGTNNGTYNSTQLGQPGYNLLDTHTSARFGYLATQNSYVGGIPIDFGSQANQSFTIETWVKGPAPATDAGIITKGTGSGGEQFNLDCGAGNHAYRFFVRQDDGTVSGASSSGVPSSSQWQHVVGVLNRPAGYVAIYVNGVSNASGTFPTDNYHGLLRTTSAMSIGSRQSGTGAYDNQFGGYLQDVAVYNYALSAAQIQAHYAAASNRAPVFVSNPFSLTNATSGQAYSANISTNASDPNGDAVTFAKVSGPAWLSVSSGGALSGTPALAQVGLNSFLVSARDSSGLSNTATLNITVLSGVMATTSTLSASLNGAPLGTLVVLTNQVSPAPPNGESVTFLDGNTVLGPGSLSGGVATYATSALTLGGHALTAVYGGDANYYASTSSVVVQYVAPNTPYVATQPATFITPTGASLNGVVTANGTNATVAWLDWGNRRGYGQTTAPTNVGSGYTLVPVSGAISNLVPGGVYYYRIVASNTLGAVWGPAVGFTTGGQVSAWGDNTFGPTNVPAGLTNVVSLSGGGYYNLVLTANGTVVGWGNNAYGQTNAPAGLSNAVAVAAGTTFSLALRGDGTVVGWGNNTYGQTNVPAGLNAVAVAAGQYQCLALQADGTVVAWGNNTYGQTNVPAGLTNVVAVAAGAQHDLALRVDGTVVAWGNNTYGQTNVPAGLKAVAIAAGQNHSLALQANGSVVAWGNNASGQTNVPAGLGAGQQVAGGGNSSLLLAADGTVVGWGDNAYGQANVPAGLSHVVAVVDNFRSALALCNPPVQAADLNLNGYANHDLAVPLAGTEPNGNPLNYRITTLPAAGTLYQSNGGQRGAAITAPDTAVSDSGGQILFAPATNAVGAPYATFNYVAGNGNSDSAPAQVTVNFSLPAAAQALAGSVNPANGTFSLNFTGDSQATYHVQASTNLVDWDVIGTGTEAPPGQYLFLDPNAPNWTRRFYRISAP